MESKAAEWISQKASPKKNNAAPLDEFVQVKLGGEVGQQVVRDRATVEKHRREEYRGRGEASGKRLESYLSLKKRAVFAVEPAGILRCPASV